MTGSDPTELYECVEAADKWCIHGKIVAHSLHMQYCMSAPTCACSQRFFFTEQVPNSKINSSKGQQTFRQF